MADVCTFNGQDLSAYGVYVEQESGLRRLSPLVADETALRFKNTVSPVWIGRRGGVVTLAVFVTDTTSATFESNLAAFKQLIAPTKDANNQPTYVPLTWGERSGRRLMVYTTEFEETQGSEPGSGGFTWTLARKPFWEDATALSQTGLTTAALISNDGDQDVSPVWTITFTGASTGFDFTVGSTRLDLDTTTFVNTNSLVIDAAARTIKKNGASVMANVNTANTTANWPKLTAQKNSLIYSEAFDNAYWTKVRASISPNAAANPVDGLTTADKLVEDASANTSHYCYTLPPVVTGIHTFSVYVKAAGRTWCDLAVEGSAKNAYFDVANGVVGNVAAGYTSAIEDAGGGWYRCSITGLCTSGQSVYYLIAEADGDAVFSGGGSSGLYIWGAQLNRGILRPYVLTTYPNLVTVNAGTNYTIGYSTRRLYE